MSEHVRHPSSYRDPAGFIFQVEGVYYRQVNQSGAGDYEWLMSSGLYDKLVDKGLLVAHQELAIPPVSPAGGAQPFKTLLPTQLDTISYAYEWGFDQLRDAALLTLKVLHQAILHGMILKDATPFNIQFVAGKPIFIDTLSFERYDPSRPWVAYRQFCECFLFPLYLEHYCGIEQRKIQTAYPDGISARLTARLLPWKSRLSPGALLHVHLQSRVRSNSTERTPAFSQQKLLNILQHLESIVKGLRSPSDADSTWNDYYQKTILSQEYLNEKEQLVRQYLDGLAFRTALDMGANDGHFSQILSERTSASILAIDADQVCINRLYRIVREKQILNILPLCIEVLNPTAAIGFRNKERASFLDRARAELVVALAVLHHLVLSGNVPLADMADYLAELTTRWLIIEFVPLEDPKAQELIRNKTVYHRPYDTESFERAFWPYFSVEKKSLVPGTARVLYLMSKNTSFS
jgi:hypothetical protein